MGFLRHEYTRRACQLVVSWKPFISLVSVINNHSFKGLTKQLEG